MLYRLCELTCTFLTVCSGLSGPRLLSICIHVLEEAVPIIAYDI
jgi:hypothetical protein